MKLIVFVLFSYLILACGAKDGLEEVNEDELLALLRNEKYVVVLFSKTGCTECDELEILLTNMREDLVETLNPWVVKTMNSNMVKLYSPSREPGLVFFRHGIPILYDGEYSEELILHTFTDNKEPVVKELSDSNFESLTQAASGATTGDWFIMFYSNDCIDCQRMQARWEAVAAKLKTRMNVARVNRKTMGRVTSRRFHIIEEPTFLFFRLGKMYWYNIPKYDVTSFVAFATDWYKNAKSEKVPLPKTPFDDLTQMIADYLREYSYPIKMVSIIGCIVFTIIVVALMKRAAEPEKKEKPKSEKKSTADKAKKVK